MKDASQQASTPRCRLLLHESHSHVLSRAFHPIIKYLNCTSHLLCPSRPQIRIHSTHKDKNSQLPPHPLPHTPSITRHSPHLQPHHPSATLIPRIQLIHSLLTHLHHTHHKSFHQSPRNLNLETCRCSTFWYRGSMLCVSMREVLIFFRQCMFRFCD